MNYYEHHIGDYAKDAGHLSMMEDGAYRRLLDVYYSREQSLPADARECCKLARATTKPEREAVAYVLREFFELRDDRHFQKRCDEEIARFHDKSAKAKASIAKRWERVRGGIEGNTNVIRTYNEGNTPRARPQSPVTSNQAKSKEQDQKQERPRKRGSHKTPLPADFAVSDRVRKWADAHGYGMLREHYEAFCSKAKAKDYRYADWDEALMGAIRDDWAKLRERPVNGAFGDGLSPAAMRRLA